MADAAAASAAIPVPAPPTNPLAVPLDDGAPEPECMGDTRSDSVASSGDVADADPDEVPAAKRPRCAPDSARDKHQKWAKSVREEMAQTQLDLNAARGKYGTKAVLHDNYVTPVLYFDPIHDAGEFDKDGMRAGLVTPYGTIRGNNMHSPRIACGGGRFSVRTHFRKNPGEIGAGWVYTNSFKSARAIIVKELTRIVCMRAFVKKMVQATKVNACVRAYVIDTDDAMDAVVEVCRPRGTRETSDMVKLVYSLDTDDIWLSVSRPVCAAVGDDAIVESRDVFPNITSAIKEATKCVEAIFGV